MNDFTGQRLAHHAERDEYIVDSTQSVPATLGAIADGNELGNKMRFFQGVRHATVETQLRIKGVGSLCS
jgi:hypothetical protein